MRTNDFVRERDEQVARDKCWQGVLESWQSTGQTPSTGARAKYLLFTAGWLAQSDYYARAKRDTAAHLAANKPKDAFPSMEATENFAAVSNGDDPSKPPLGPVAATTEWYWKRADAPEVDRDAFIRGWNGAALWNNRRLAEENHQTGAMARKTLAKAIANVLDAAMLCRRSELADQLLAGEHMDRCVACGQQDELHLVQGEMACIECIDARIDSAESDLDAVREVLRPRPLESIKDACRRVRDGSDGRLDEVKPRIQHAYERGVLHVIDKLFDHGEKEAAIGMMEAFHVVQEGSRYRIDPNLASTQKCVEDLFGDPPVMGTVIPSGAGRGRSG